MQVAKRCGHVVEPRPAVAVGQWLTAFHLGDSGFGVELITVDHDQPKASGECFCESALAAAAHAHHDDGLAVGSRSGHAWKTSIGVPLG